MGASAISIAIEPPASAEARACLDAYILELVERFETAFDPNQSKWAPDDDAISPPSGCFMIARLDGRPVGCGALRTLDTGLGEIKRMWVHRDVRGRGIAWRLLEALEAHARGLGMTRVRLDTNRALTQAQAMYLKAGYREIPRFNDNPYADFWFEKTLG